MAHSQNHFKWDSLDAHMCFNIQSIKQYNGNLGGDDLEYVVFKFPLFFCISTLYLSQTELNSFLTPLKENVYTILIIFERV